MFSLGRDMKLSLTGVSMTKMIEAMSLFGKDDWDEFSNELIDVYINSKSKDVQGNSIANTKLHSEEGFMVGETYFYNWSNGNKTVRVTVTDNGAKILSGSDFEMDDVGRLSQGHLVKRNRLIESNYIQNGKFTRDYVCGSLSAAGSIARGIQMSAKNSFKQNEKLDWTAIVVQAIEQLGGDAHLDEIYKKIEELHPDRLTPHYQNTVRGTIYKNSSDSEFFQEKQDLFKRIGKGRTGRWAIREYKE